MLLTVIQFFTISNQILFYSCSTVYPRTCKYESSEYIGNTAVSVITPTPYTVAKVGYYDEPLGTHEKPCTLLKQKNVQKKGRCLKMFCVVAKKFYQNKVR